MSPPSARSKSSQWAVNTNPSFSAFARPSSRHRELCTGLPSSLTATAPAAFSAAISVHSRPSIPFVTQAAVYTLAQALPARSKRSATSSGLSMGGVVFGMANRLVTPPAAAARQAEYTSSLWVCPGSRRWTCISTNPGAAMSPRQSTTSQPSGSRPSPRAAILSPSIRRSPIKSSPWEGSITLGPFNSIPTQRSFPGPSPGVISVLLYTILSATEARGHSSWDR